MYNLPNCQAPYEETYETKDFYIELQHTFDIKTNVETQSYDEIEGHAVEVFNDSYMSLYEVLDKCKAMIQRAKEVNEALTVSKRTRVRKSREYSRMLATITLYMDANEEMEEV